MLESLETETLRKVKLFTAFLLFYYKKLLSNKSKICTHFMAKFGLSMLEVLNDFRNI